MLHLTRGTSFLLLFVFLIFSQVHHHHPLVYINTHSVRLSNEIFFKLFLQKCWLITGYWHPVHTGSPSKTLHFLDCKELSVFLCVFWHLYSYSNEHKQVPCVGTSCHVLKPLLVLPNTSTTVQFRITFECRHFHKWKKPLQYVGN